MAQAEIKRTAVEMQRAHDLLVTALFAQEDELDAHTFACMMASASVLCWLLGHEYNTGFARNLEALEKDMQERGIQLVDLGELHGVQ
jgi:hypothetical protein